MDIRCRKHRTTRLRWAAFAVAACIATASSSIVGAAPALGTSSPVVAGSAPFVGTAPNGGAHTENVFEPNELRPVDRTTTYPNRAIGLLVVRFWNRYEQCTGFMVGRNTVLTAGHCVNDPSTNRWASSATFYPGNDGTTTPYGACDATRFFALPSYVAEPQPQESPHDLGAVKLNCNIGNTVGWFGFLSVIWTGQNAHIRGYPGEGEEGMFRASGPIEATEGKELFHRIDTGGGESGAPVFANMDPPGSALGRGVYAFAVHAGGGLYTNWATRITTARVTTIVGWKQAP